MQALELRNEGQVVFVKTCVEVLWRTALHLKCSGTGVRNKKTYVTGWGNATKHTREGWVLLSDGVGV